MTSRRVTVDAKPSAPDYFAEKKRADRHIPAHLREVKPRAARAGRRPRYGRLRSSTPPPDCRCRNALEERKKRADSKCAELVEPDRPSEQCRGAAPLASVSSDVRPGVRDPRRSVAAVAEDSARRRIPVRRIWCSTS